MCQDKPFFRNSVMNKDKIVNKFNIAIWNISLRNYFKFLAQNDAKK